VPDVADDPGAKDLVARARASLDRAYVPYSHFPVAAAVLDVNGNVFTGVNVENSSYGLTVCAERIAIFNAIAAGSRKLCAIAVTAEKEHPVMPCGACRQVMTELLEKNAHVYLDAGATIQRWTVPELLPSAFTPENLLSHRPR